MTIAEFDGQSRDQRVEFCTVRTLDAKNEIPTHSQNQSWKPKLRARPEAKVRAIAKAKVKIHVPKKKTGGTLIKELGFPISFWSKIPLNGEV